MGLGAGALPRMAPLLRRTKLEFDHMKFQPDDATGVNIISRTEGQRLWVSGSPHDHSVLVPWNGEVLPWDVSDPAVLTPAHFERILALKPALVIFGSGTRLQFVKPALYRSLIDHGIGMETMDTGAACRTYNVLASEGRQVVAALILGV
jgi:uncharacterized protein